MKNKVVVKTLICAFAMAIAGAHLIPAQAAIDCRKVTSSPTLQEPTLPAFRTARTIVRPLQNQDVEPAIRILTHPKSLEMSGDKLEAARLRESLSGALHSVPDSAWKQEVVFSVISKNTHQVIGVLRVTGLFAVKKSPIRNEPGWKDEFEKTYPYATLGYAIEPALWGRGLMNEVLSEAVPYAARNLGVRSVSAYVRNSNVRSQRVLTANGFSLLEETDSVALFRRDLKNGIR